MQTFKEYSSGKKKAFVRSDDADTIASALFDQTACEVLEKGGRGRVLRFPLRNGQGILRKYMRGGAIRYFINDLYFMDNRPLKEWKIHTWIFEQGISVPEPLGVMWEQHGLFFSGSIATLEIESQNLLEFLLSESANTEAILFKVGKLICQMHELGVFHADLQVRNILIDFEKQYLIDFDSASRTSELLPRRRFRNLLRLKRSFQKNNLPVKHFHTLCEGYGVQSFPGWLEKLYSVKAQVSDVLSGNRK